MNLFFILMQNIIFILLVSCVVADPFFSSLLYQDVSNQYCTRYYHRMGGVGCRTSLSGLRGIAIPIQEDVSTPLRIPICRVTSRSNLSGKNQDVVLGHAFFRRFLVRTEFCFSPIESVVLEAVKYKSVVGIVVCGNETSVSYLSVISP